MMWSRTRSGDTCNLRAGRDFANHHCSVDKFRIQRARVPLTVVLQEKDKIKATGPFRAFVYGLSGSFDVTLPCPYADYLLVEQEILTGE